jgi:hypothetical protein
MIHSTVSGCVNASFSPAARFRKDAVLFLRAGDNGPARDRHAILFGNFFRYLTNILMITWGCGAVAGGAGRRPAARWDMSVRRHSGQGGKGRY